MALPLITNFGIARLALSIRNDQLSHFLKGWNRPSGFASCLPSPKGINPLRHELAGIGRGYPGARKPH
jgi:hypothetical protein